MDFMGAKKIIFVLLTISTKDSRSAVLGWRALAVDGVWRFSNTGSKGLDVPVWEW